MQEVRGKAKVLGLKNIFGVSKAELIRWIQRGLPQAFKGQDKVIGYGRSASHDPKELKLGLEVLQRDYPNSEWTKKAQVYSLIP